MLASPDLGCDLSRSQRRTRVTAPLKLPGECPTQTSATASPSTACNDVNHQVGGREVGASRRTPGPGSGWTLLLRGRLVVALGRHSCRYTQGCSKCGAALFLFLPAFAVPPQPRPPPRGESRAWIESCRPGAWRVTSWRF